MVRFREGARLDTSGVQDRRGGGGRAVAVGGGGIGVLGLIAFVLVQVLGGGGGTGSGADVASILAQLQGGGSGTADNTELAQECRTGADANDSADCAAVAIVDSIQDYWSTALPQTSGTAYADTQTVFFTGSVQTACGGATSGSGPFYCPGDQLVYVDLTFFDQLQTQFGARGGTFVDAYVLAHEYGHHVQNLLGTNQRVTPGETGPTSGTVRLELQADCYAGVWANHATTVSDDGQAPLITEITQDDVDRALDAASRIGDDFIQTNLGNGTVDQDAFTHGSSAQRERWFSTGYQTGDPAACDTFGTDDLG
ncbi:neutral zinc metallopeptidase [Klenkia sp. PcliD-1-E]|uniref:KPN_02809 family neutral zinc metallopeptidase n=1 Tax=Klenkia sp. PcliD-1-E TaxID=2954492 RepID=UPI002097AE0A|nr:neutral zinc metallopeptidase [Klenkia sp. PcliD-1-E]MCO7221359.1 neutral zinc metallopeptidase [Klenkia sp. PcliD-1-E]